MEILMKKELCLILFVMACLPIREGFSAEPAPPALVQYARQNLAQLGRSPVIVKEVSNQNSRNLNMDEVKRNDDRWRSTRGIAEFMRPLMNSQCAGYLRAIQKSKKYFMDITVVDSRGVSVAMSEKTREYWHRDREFFTQVMNGAEGSLFVGDMEFDTSLQIYMVHVGVPVYEGDRVIGAISIGIDVDQFEKTL